MRRKKNKTNLEAIEILVNSKKTLLDHLKRVIKIKSFNYRTFGTEIEDFVIDRLIDIFKKSGFIKGKKDYKRAKDKNEFPDFTLFSETDFAIEIKSGNHSKKLSGRWVKCKNSNNDMGTLNKWPHKLEQFGGENIYYIFIEYNFTDSKKEILEVKIAPFYKFLGLNRDGLLKYREKDGNLRPKDFDEKSPINSFKQFNDLFKKTYAYRSRRIIKKHQEILKLLSSRK